MANVEHASLTGSALHEPKGVASATIGQVYVADGSGSGTWTSLTSTTPVGTVSDFAGSTAPSGWLLCYGQAISRTTYAELFAVLGTTYGTGNGSTTFNLPDCRGRTTYGKDNMGGSSSGTLTSTYYTSGAPTTLGSKGGGESVTLSQTHLPNINITSTPNSATQSLNHTISSGSGLGLSGSATPTTIFYNTGASSFSYYATGFFGNLDNHTVNFPNYTTPLGGSGTAFSRVAPGIVFNKIIFANA